MNKKELLMRFFITVPVIAFIFMLITKADICKSSVENAIVLCSGVLIPSLYPFSVCVLLLTDLRLFSGKKDNSQNILAKFFGLPLNLAVVVILSFIGGYPVGAKLLNSAVKRGEISPENAEKMLFFCVNAGPAFIVSAVGAGILNSRKSGLILLLSHILASLIIFCGFRIINGQIKSNPTPQTPDLPFADKFVKAASDGANVTMSICAFVILFSAITAYIEYYSANFPPLKSLLYCLEVTTTVTKTRNIYLISFLLGFAGLCVWCQIISLTGDIKINLFKFAVFRIVHGILSTVLTFGFIKLFKITVPVFSNNKTFGISGSVSGRGLSFALFIMSLIFIVSVSGKTENRKILEEFK